MSDEIRVTTFVAAEATLRSPAKKIEDHWCEHPGCARWGSLGFEQLYGTVWFCGEHREDGERR